MLQYERQPKRPNSKMVIITLLLLSIIGLAFALDYYKKEKQAKQDLIDTTYILPERILVKGKLVQVTEVDENKVTFKDGLDNEYSLPNDKEYKLNSYWFLEIKDGEIVNSFQK